VDATGLIRLEEALPERASEVVTGAPVASLTYDGNPGAGPLLGVSPDQRMEWDQGDSSCPSTAT
jgi:hypothetical protein